MDITDFYPLVVVDSVSELDFLDSDLAKLRVADRPIFYRVAGEDLQVPDLISWKVYDTEYLWWVICLAAGVENPFEEFEVSAQIVLPNQLDLAAWQKEALRR